MFMLIFAVVPLPFAFVLVFVDRGVLAVVVVAGAAVSVELALVGAIIIRVTVTTFVCALSVTAVDCVSFAFVAAVFASVCLSKD